MPWCTVDTDLAAMAFDDGSADKQAKTQATIRLGRGIGPLPTIVQLPDPSQILGSDARAFICDRDAQRGDLSGQPYRN
jgi:hypothetical protein